MKNRDLFIPSFTTLIIFGLSWFLNCAHQNRVRDGIDAGVEQTEDSDLSSVESSDSSDELAAADSNPEQEPGTEKTTELSDSDLNELTGDSTAASETQSGATANTLDAEADLAKLEPQNSADIPSESTGTLMADPTTPPDSLLIPEPAAPTSPEPVVAQAPDVYQEIQAIPTTPPFEESAFDAPKSAPKATRSVWKSSRVPKIPANAVNRKGQQLNRFYFVRQGDSARSVASLVYGDDKRARDLKAWNAGWTPGDVVYYVSPTEPGDRKMRSFYQENSITPDEYKVQRGDWLSRIASKKLGNAGSWKEIAVVNGLKSADSLEVGHKLAIYPRDLAQFVHEPEVADNTLAPVQEPEPMQAPVTAQPIPEPQAQPQPEIAIPTPQPEVITPEPRVVTEQPAVEAESLSPKKNKNQDVDFGKFVEQNIVAAVIIGGMVMLLLALASRRKKRARAQSSDEFGDDLPGEPPTKIKRK